MHIAILARVRGLLAQFTEVHGDSVWLPRRALSLTAVYDTGFDAVDLVSTHPPRVGHLLRRRLDPGHPHALTRTL